MPSVCYSLVKCDRKTIAIRVTEDNEVVVRAPRSVSVAEVERLLEEKRAWIERALAFNACNSLACADVKNYCKAYVSGRLVPVRFGRRNFIDDEGVHVTGVKGFKAAYVNSLGGQFIERFRRMQEACGLYASDVTVRSYKNVWGRCDGKGNIAFSFKLLMLPRELQDYVMLHELCHVVHCDHSEKFWALVGSFLPDWKTKRARLKRYAFLARMY